MSIYKNKDIYTNINERGVNLGNVDVTLYSRDKLTAALRIFLNKEVKYRNETIIEPVNLTQTNMLPMIDLYAEDGSIFKGEKLRIISAETGLVEYDFPRNIVDHVGKMNASIYLESEDEGVEVARFYFYIDDDGLTKRIGREISPQLFEDLLEGYLKNNSNVFNEIESRLNAWQKVNLKENLFDKYLINTTISDSSGNEFSNDSTTTSEYIKVDDSKKYTVGVKRILDDNYALVKLAYYDMDQSHISSIDWINLASENNKVISLPEATRYVRVIVNNTHKDVVFFNEGEEPYYNSSDSVSIFNTLIPDNSITEDKLIEALRNKLKTITKITNLFTVYNDKTTLSNKNGTEYANDITVTSRNYIAIDDNHFYTIGLEKIVDSTKSLTKVAFYNEKQEFISITDWINLAEENDKVLTPPIGARYVKIVVNNESRNQLYFNEGEKPYYLENNNKTSTDNSILEPELSTFLQDMILNYTKNTNLFNSYKEKTTLSRGAGNELENDTTVASKDFIYVDSSKEYIIGLKEIVDITKGLARIFYYDGNHSFISATDWLNLAENNKQVITLPEDTKYVKLVINTEHKDELYFNLGTTPYYITSGNTVQSPNKAELDKTINLVQETKPNLTLSTTGYETPNNMYSVTDFISVISDSDYTVGINPITSTSELVKYVFYDSSKVFISISDWFTFNADKKHMNIKTPFNAKYFRLVFPLGKDSNIYFNKGTEPYFVVKEKQLEEESKELVNKVINDLDLDQLKEEKKPLKPYPNKLMWKVLEENTNIKPLTMNREGTVIYASNGARVSQSTDDGKTWTYVGGVLDGRMVQGIRVLDDGELIVTTSRDKTNNIKSKLYKSSNYSVENPENTTYTEKLEMHNLDANFNNPWCLDNYYNIVLASDYGGHYLTGARYVYMSTDYGETWETIFDQKEVSETVDGAPSYTTDAHVHTCHYDRYRDRIWVCVGDQDNTATYYSDDMGKTWEIIKGYTGKDTMQYTGITSYPEGVFFGSDRAPDGVYFWDAKQPNDIKPFYLTERDEIRTLVYALPFRRFAEKDEVTYFVGNRDGIVDGEMGPLIVGLKGVLGAQLLYDFTDDFNQFTYTDISGCLGNTAQGNVIVSVKDKNTNRYRLLRAKAPVWE